MAKKKKTIIVIIGIILLAALLIGIGAIFLLSGPKILQAENTYKKEYMSFCKAENDPDMQIDGVLDEDKWQNKKWFKNTYIQNTNGLMPNLKVTAFSTEYGVYIAAVAEDTNIVNDGDHTMESNSAFDICVAVNDVDEKEYDSSLYATNLVIDMRGDCHTAEASGFKRAVVVDGEINSRQTKSATLEMFLPWEFLRVDTTKGIPEVIYLFPNYRGVLEGEQYVTDMKKMAVFPTINAISSYWKFDKNGYMTEDKEGAVAGDSVTGLAKTGNWDISHEEDGVVESSYGTEAHAIFFKDKYCSDFIAEATIVPVKSMADGTKEIGFFFMSQEGHRNTVVFEVNDELLVDGINGTKNLSQYKLITYDSKDWVRNIHTDCYRENKNAKTKEGIKLSVVKYGDTFWYFADDEYLTAEQKDFLDTKVFPAFYSYSMDTIFKDYSCNEIDIDGAKKYLNERGVYLVDAQATNSGGTVTTSKLAISKGESFDITITCNSGYEVASLMVNGVEKLEDAMKNANGGVYTIKASDGNQEIRVTFKKCDGYNLTGVVKGGDNALSAKVIVTGETNRILRYEVSAAGDKGYKVNMPAGKYYVYVEAEDYIPVTEKIDLSKDTVKDFALKLSAFAQAVEVNGKTVYSNTGVWDRSKEGIGKVSGSYSKGTSWQPLYFRETGKSAWFSATVSYTTKFEEGKSYQSDLLGGLMITDGTQSGWFGIRQHGLVYNGTWIEHVIGYDVLSTWAPEHLSAKLDIILKDGLFYVYVDDIFVTKLELSKVVAGAGADKEVAVGLMMHADKPADIEFSNIKFTTDAKQVSSALEAKEAGHTIPEGTLFAQYVTVNGCRLESMPYRWDLSEIKNNTVTCINGMSSQPIYFAQTGNTALVRLTVIRTDDFKNAENPEGQPLAGIVLSDGKHTGYVGIRNNGVVYNDIWLNNSVNYDILATWSAEEHLSATLDIVVKDDQIFLYVDGNKVKALKVSDVLPGVTPGQKLAIGLVSETNGKSASVKFADVQFTTDGTTVDSYIAQNEAKENVPAGSIFTKSVNINGKTVESVVYPWDLSKIAQNVVTGKNGSSSQPLYFAQTGTQALLQTKVTRTDDFANAANPEGQPLAGIYVTDGTNQGYVGIRANAVVYNGNWLNGSVGYDILTTWDPSHLSAQLDIVFKDNQFRIYVDNILVKTLKLSDVLAGVVDNTSLAFGLTVETDGKTADVEYSDVKFTTDSAKIEEYLKGGEDSPFPSDSIFAEKVTVNGNEAASVIGRWDLSRIAQNVATGKMGTVAQPLYFAQTGTQALIQTKVTRTDDFANAANPEGQPLAGIFVTDGTNQGYVGIRANAVVYNGNWLNGSIGYDILTTWDPNNLSAQLDVVFKDNQFQIYVNGIFAKALKLSDVVIGSADNTSLAFGLTVETDGKTADVEYSDVKFTTDPAKIEAYLKGGEDDSPVPSDSIFAKKVTVNEKEAVSAMEVWDLSKIAENVVTGKNGNSSQPLYFAQTGTQALLQTKVTRTDDFANAANPEGQPLAGIFVTDGTNQGYVGIRANAVVYNDNWLNGSVGYDILTTWSAAENQNAQFDIVLQDGVFYIYVDGVFIRSLNLSEVLPNAAEDSVLAFGLTMEASGKAAEIQYSNVQFTTAEAKVTEFLGAHNSLFKEAVTFSNGATRVYSDYAKWDTGSLAENILRGSYALGSSWSGMYFANTGKAALIHTVIKRTDALEAGCFDAPKAMIWVNNGAGGGVLGIKANAVAYAGKEEWGVLPYAVLTNWDTRHLSVSVDIAYKDGTFYLYVDGSFVRTFAIEDILPGATKDTELAFGFTMDVGAPAQLDYTDIQFTTDVTKVTEFLNPNP